MENPKDAKKTSRRINLQRNAVKRNMMFIHDRYIRDKAFRKAMIEIGRTEQMIVEMDKLANGGPHLHSQQGRNRVLPWQLVDPLESGMR